MKSVYDKRTEEVRNALDGERTCYEPNKIYKGDTVECLYYINTHGFYHVLMPGKVKWSDGSIMCYTINDYRLNPDNTFHLTGQTDFYTKEERYKYILKLAENAA